MPRSSAVRQDVQDDYVRQLLDQRATSADFHARFSASDLSDTTSEYSHSLYSAHHPPSIGGPPSPTSAHYLASHGHIPPISIADRERLNDPSCSSLDFDDASDVSPPASLRDEQEDSGISSLGPKMRFHSRAPWEIEETLHENETTHELTRTITNKTMAHAARFFNFGPSSPRVSNVSRASGESVHPEVVHKISLDGSAGKKLLPGGAIYGLHKQATISNVSLGRVTNDAKSDRIPLPSLDPPSPTSAVSSPYATSFLCTRRSVDADPARLNRASFDYGGRRDSTDNGHIFFSSPTPSESQQSYHPYANPDLAISRSPDPYDSLDSLSASHQIISSGSANTATESSTSSSESTSTATLTPDSSTPSVEPSSTVLGREISKPVPLRESNDPCSLLPSGVHKLPGWMEKSTPSFGLISLEEARARRARSATQPPLTGRPSNVSLDEESIPEFDSGAVVQDAQLPQELDNQRPRVRSSSAGAKAKNALQNIKGAQPRAETLPGPFVHVGPAPGKSLKQKKSGFLRLLIGSKTHDQEDRVQPPPLPTLSDVQQIVSRTSKTHRIPAPKLTIVPDGVESKANNGGSTSPTGLVAGPKRVRPLLSIGTESSQQLPTFAISESPQMQTVTVDAHKQQWLAANASRSAPANIHNFPPSIPPLQLRPVSMLFSSHFEEHLSKEDSRPSLETDTSTLRSPSCYSPVTPRSIGLFSNEKIRKTSTENDDQSALIKALQDQITSSNIAWQRQVRELEGQVRDLKAQLNANPCETCGRLKSGFNVIQQSKTGRVNRPKA